MKSRLFLSESAPAGGQDSIGGTRHMTGGVCREHHPAVLRRFAGRSWIALSVVLLGLPLISSAATTINAVNHFAYGANIGWIDWRGNDANGAIVGEFVCSGYIYSANAGWVHLGDGTPANNIRYQNDSAVDFGVNHDGAGNLYGYAYGANIGWLTFTNRDGNGAVFNGPKVDLLTGRLSGFVWSANCGWISLSNSAAFVQTDTMPMGGDGDRDGIPDAWELLHFANLITANAGSDTDADGSTDAQEYLADTDPTNAASNLAITSFSAGSPSRISWTSKPTRQYRLLGTTDIAKPSPWPEIGLGLIAPDAGLRTTRHFMDGASAAMFYQIEAVRPLSP